MFCKSKCVLNPLSISLSFSSARSTDHLTKYSELFLSFSSLSVCSIARSVDIENEDEPIHLDLGPMDYTRRMTELQRRNLSQPKHLRTAYALETMDQNPDDFSSSFIRKGMPINEETSARQRVNNENQKGSEVRAVIWPVMITTIFDSL